MLSSTGAARAGRAWAHSAWATVGLASGLALLLGVLVAVATPLAVVAGLLGAVALALVLARPLLGLFGFVGVVATLPFGVIPVQAGAQLTFVDAVLIATFASFLARLPALARQPGGLRCGRPGAWLLGFVLVASVAFVLGSGTSGAAPELLRRFAKLLASMLLFFVALNLVRSRATLEGLVRALMVAGALVGGVGTVLWLLPPSTQLAALSALRVVGYPTADVLRYIPGPNDTYTSQLRATGTAVDPNVFGGTLMLALGLITLQWVARERLFSRPVLLALGLPALAGVLVSFSRASWLGLAAGVLAVGSARARRLWLVVPVALALMLLTPGGQVAAQRFVAGFSSSDPATALRLGEYRNALTLIQRYPLLGIGFGVSPDIDVTTGVSSVYLLVGEQTGLVGLGVYAGALLAVLASGVRTLGAVRDERLRGVVSGLLAAFVAALVAGLLDHYFANLAFPHAVALFWLYAALLVAAAYQARAAGAPPRG